MLRHIVILCLTYWGTRKLFFTMVIQLCIPTKYENSSFLYILPNTLFSMKKFFFPVGLCISLVTNDVEYHFMCLLVVYRFSLDKFRSLVHFLIGYLFISSKNFHRYMIGKYFIPSCELSYLLSWWYPWSRCFLCWWSPDYLCFLVLLMLLVLYIRIPYQIWTH